MALSCELVALAQALFRLGVGIIRPPSRHKGEALAAETGSCRWRCPLRQAPEFLSGSRPFLIERLGQAIDQR